MVTEHGTIRSRLSQTVAGVTSIPKSVGHFIERWVDGDYYLDPAVAQALGGALEAVALLGVAGVAYAVAERSRPPRPVLVTEQVGGEVDIEAVLDRIDQLSRGQADLQQGEFFTAREQVTGVGYFVHGLSPDEEPFVWGGNAHPTSALVEVDGGLMWSMWNNNLGPGFQVQTQTGLYTCYSGIAQCDSK